jgi:exodeoxyribonuclease VII large subunit
MEPISVSQYLDRLNLKLKSEKAKIVGEVSGLKLHQNGHYYFSLLDKSDQSKIDCVIWRSNYRLFGVELKDGIQVISSVSPNIYKPNGRISFIVDSIELAGEGALKMAYEKLKKKLSEEGLFSETRKREIPKYPHRIGVITSRTGAVIHDFNTNLGKFGYKILLADSRVEGQDALKDLLSALNTLKKEKIDVLVIIRGGGSLEAFQAYNNEVFVREVATFPVPTITGLGHDQDAPLVSFVSDKNVSTPTAVANLLNFSWQEALSQVSLYQERIFSYFQASIFDAFRLAEDTMFREAERIGYDIQRISDSLLQSERDLGRGFNQIIQNLETFLKDAEKTIEFGSPEGQLKRGYSIISHNGKVVRKIKDVKVGDDLNLRLSDGMIESKVI